MAHFPPEWLTPCILLYTQRDYSTKYPNLKLPKLEPSVLLAETHTPRPLQSPTVHISLSINELPVRGDLIGIDAEFVTLNQVHIIITILIYTVCVCVCVCVCCE